ncbi:MAG: BspA family leucine-rich repeat surface protein [Lachnospiraceae bacterium]|nr:BspA family leucine-rich repeat surface protein [Lachnospiraceae bacterium]
MSKTRYLDDKDIDLMIAKLKLLGYSYSNKDDAVEVTSPDKNNVYIFIKSDVNEINASLNRFNEDTVVHIIGGSGLEKISCLTRYTDIGTLDISMLDTRNAIDLSSMFFLSSLTILGLNKIETYNVENMSGMFYGCRTKELDLSSFDTSNVLGMSQMFFGCEVYKLDLSGFNTSKVKTMNKMFKDAKITEIDLSNFRTDSLLDADFMFSRCTASKVNLSNFDTSKVVGLLRMFNGCKIDELDLSNFTLDIKRLSAAGRSTLYEMFDDSEIGTLKISNAKIGSQINIDRLFEHSSIGRIIK